MLDRTCRYFVVCVELKFRYLGEQSIVMRRNIIIERVDD